MHMVFSRADTKLWFLIGPHKANGDEWEEMLVRLVIYSCDVLKSEIFFCSLDACYHEGRSWIQSLMSLRQGVCNEDLALFPRNH